MSDEIQAIATNNYVLHNIDAKKLYVQEPLFTANSGDAVYVGWRPDETVLYSGEIIGSAECTLSETLNNFERFRIKYRCWSDDYTVHELVQPADHSLHLFQSVDGFGNGDALFMNIFSGNDDKTKISYLHNYYWNPVQGGSKQEGLNNARIYSVIGVNRKENA